MPPHIGIILKICFERWFRRQCTDNNQDKAQMFKTAKMVFIISVLLTGITMHASGYNDTEYARFFINKKCHKCDLYRANFSGADLTNADFTGSNLILANFQKATLLNVVFKNATLTGANFSGAMWIDGSICQQGSYGRCIKKTSK